MRNIARANMDGTKFANLVSFPRREPSNLLGIEGRETVGHARQHLTCLGVSFSAYAPWLLRRAILGACTLFIFTEQFLVVPPQF